LTWPQPMFATSKCSQNLPKVTEACCFGDKAYFSEPLRQELLAEQGLELSVPTNYGKPTHLDDKQLRFRKRIRRLTETVGSQLNHYFAIKKTWTRDMWHLTNRIYRKILAHTHTEGEPVMGTNISDC